MSSKLEDVSLCALEGECLGFQGLTYSGKGLLVGLLTNMVEEDIHNHRVYIEGKRMMNNEKLAEKVYRIVDSNYIIDDWTVAE